MAMLVCCLFSVPVLAGDDNGNTKDVPCLKDVILKPVKGIPKRPNTPSRIYIECRYCPEYLEFSFPDGVTSLSVFLSNDDNSLMDVASLESPIVYIPILYGEYGITCTTEDGREFYGTLYF